MRKTVIPMQSITFAAVAGLLCVWAGPAQCQRSGRQFTGSAAAGCPAGSGTQTGTTATGTTTTGTTTGTTTIQTSLASRAASQILARRSAAASSAAAAQASSVISAQRTAANQVLVAYTGPTTSAQRVFIGVLDANGQVLDQRAISQLPVQASFTLTGSAKYYGVRVVYANGMSATAYSPIQ